MFEKDSDLRAFALTVWANHIETGDTVLSSLDAMNCGAVKKIRVLSVSQMELVARLRRLAAAERQPARQTNAR